MAVYLEFFKKCIESGRVTFALVYGLVLTIMLLFTHRLANPGVSGFGSYRSHF